MWCDFTSSDSSFLPPETLRNRATDPVTTTPRSFVVSFHNDNFGQPHIHDPRKPSQFRTPSQGFCRCQSLTADWRMFHFNQICWKPDCWEVNHKIQDQILDFNRRFGLHADNQIFMYKWIHIDSQNILEFHPWDPRLSLPTKCSSFNPFHTVKGLCVPTRYLENHGKSSSQLTRMTYCITSKADTRNGV